MAKYCGALSLIVIYYCIFSSNSSSVRYETINAHLINKRVDRLIDISTQIVKISQKIVLENHGTEVALGYLFSIDLQLERKLAFITVHCINSEFQFKSKLRVTDTKVIGHEDNAFKYITLKDALHPKQSVTIGIEAIYTHRLVPLPSHITQNEDQLVMFIDSHYFYSPYCTGKQTTSVVLSSTSIENGSHLKPFKQSNNVFMFGPYLEITPFSVSNMSFHYINNQPFLTIRNLERVIEVSPWGNIAIKETVSLEHTGAIHKGPFSRIESSEHMPSPGEMHSGKACIRSFVMFLPASAKDIYYRDEIGIISSFKIKTSKDYVELELTPRFPLFGGWKTSYVIGYNVPTYEYLYTNGSDYILKMRLIDHVFNDMCIDEMTTKIIPPEGYTNVWLTVPFPVEHLPDSFYCSYLDSTCRLAISVMKNNVIENHIEDFELYFNFSQIVMLKKPLLVSAAVFIVCVTYSVIKRMDYRIDKN